MLSRFIGKCIQCKSSLTPASDEESRKWAMCARCGAQYPLEQGHLIVGEQSDRANENSLP